MTNIMQISFACLVQGKYFASLAGTEQDLLCKHFTTVIRNILQLVAYS